MFKSLENKGVFIGLGVIGMTAWISLQVTISINEKSIRDVKNQLIMLNTELKKQNENHHSEVKSLIKAIGGVAFSSLEERKNLEIRLAKLEDKH